MFWLRADQGGWRGWCFFLVLFDVVNLGVSLVWCSRIRDKKLVAIAVEDSWCLSHLLNRIYTVNFAGFALKPLKSGSVISCELFLLLFKCLGAKHEKINQWNFSQERWWICQCPPPLFVAFFCSATNESLIKETEKSTVFCRVDVS